MYIISTRLRYTCYDVFLFAAKLHCNTHLENVLIIDVMKKAASCKECWVCTYISFQKIP